MPRGRLLRGVTNGVADSFMSRNNDIEGYWGPGRLYLLAKRLDLSFLTLDLLDTYPAADHGDIVVAEKYYTDLFLRNLMKAGFDRIRVKNARIKIAFETHGDYPKPNLYTRGEPFLVAVTITSDKDRSHEAVRVGRCALHDPLLDMRRGGFD